MVAGDVLFAHALAEVVGHPLGQPAGVHEDQCCPVPGDQFGHAVVDLRPLLVRRDRAQVRCRHLHGEVQIALVPAVDDDAVGTPAAVHPLRSHQERGRLLNGPLRRRQPHAAGPPLGDMVQASQRQRQVAPSSVPHQRVNLVHNERLDVPKRRPALLRGEHQIERFRCRNENVGRAARNRLSFAGGRIATADGNADLRQRLSELLRDFPDLAQRALQVAMDVAAQRLER